MGERQQFKPPPFTPLLFTTHTTATPHLTCPQDAFFGPHPQIHLLSLLEVAKPVTFGCSAELTQAWQCISRQHTEDAAKADATFKSQIPISVTQ